MADIDQVIKEKRAALTDILLGFTIVAYWLKPVRTLSLSIFQKRKPWLNL
jgi:hypothetical protein